jgi:hypothetical protein
VNALSRFLFSAVLVHVAWAPAAAQENARGAWRATNNDCFIQAFVLGDRGMASVSYSNAAGEQRAQWTWGREGLNIVSDQRGVLLMDGHYEDAVLVAEVDYSTTDDVDFRICRFTRLDLLPRIHGLLWQRLRNVLIQLQARAIRIEHVDVPDMGA